MSGIEVDVISEEAWSDDGVEMEEMERDVEESWIPAPKARSSNKPSKESGERKEEESLGRKEKPTKEIKIEIERVDKEKSEKQKKEERTVTEEMEEIEKEKEIKEEKEREKEKEKRKEEKTKEEKKEKEEKEKNERKGSQGKWKWQEEKITGGKREQEREKQSHPYGRKERRTEIRGEGKGSGTGTGKKIETETRKETNQTSIYVYEGYPKNTMTGEEKNDITKVIGNEALKRGLEIRVKRHGLKNGGLIITHEGDTLRKLMDDLIETDLKIRGLKVIRGEENALNRQHEISIRVNNPRVSDQELLEWIERSEKGTKAGKWRITKSGSPQENGREITAKIGGGALKILRKAGMKIYIGGGLHSITFREKKG